MLSPVFFRHPASVVEYARSMPYRQARGWSPESTTLASHEVHLRFLDDVGDEGAVERVRFDRRLR